MAHFNNTQVDMAIERWKKNHTHIFHWLICPHMYVVCDVLASTLGVKEFGFDIQISHIWKFRQIYPHGQSVEFSSLDFGIDIMCLQHAPGAPINARS